MQVAPALCQTFKGLTASDLYEKYHGEGGYARLELDLAVAAEISDQVSEHIGKDKKKNAKAAVSRRNQRRAQRESKALTDDEAVQLLKDAGVLSD